MPSFPKFRRSWQVFRNSLQVMAGHPKLLLFPLVTFGCTVVIALFFFAPVVLLPTGHPLGTGAHWLAVATRWGDLVPAEGHTQHWHPKLVTYLYLVAIYLVSMISATFFNVAFYHEIMRALAGERVSLRAGLGFARGRLRSLLLWSLFAGAVGLLIRTLEERFGWLGRLVMRLVGTAWSVASVFVIPVMIRDASANPLALLKNSAATLKKTWGEALIGYVGMGLGSGLLLLGSLLFCLGAGVLAYWAHRPMLLVPLGLVWAVGAMAFSYAVGVANDIFCCALYIYASEGVVPGAYTVELMDAAWKVKRA
jgi:Family of unknown function (DUF6159)